MSAFKEHVSASPPSIILPVVYIAITLLILFYIGRWAFNYMLYSYVSKAKSNPKRSKKRKKHKHSSSEEEQDEEKEDGDFYY